MTTFHTPARRAPVWRAATYAAGFALVLLVVIELASLVQMFQWGDAHPAERIWRYWWQTRTVGAYPVHWRDALWCTLVIFLIGRGWHAWRARKGTSDSETCGDVRNACNA